MKLQDSNDRILCGLIILGTLGVEDDADYGGMLYEF